MKLLSVILIPQLFSGIRFSCCFVSSPPKVTLKKKSIFYQVHWASGLSHLQVALSADTPLHTSGASVKFANSSVSVQKTSLGVYRHTLL